MHNIYYVYMYLREDGTPYYVGKGSTTRAFYKAKSEHVKVPEDKSRIRFIKENLSENDAFMWEHFWIAEFGRIDLDTGILENRSNGGNGVTGVSNHYEGIGSWFKDKQGKNHLFFPIRSCVELNLDPRKMSSLRTGLRKSYKGWTFLRDATNEERAAVKNCDPLQLLLL